MSPDGVGTLHVSNLEGEVVEGVKSSEKWKIRCVGSMRD